MGTRLSGLVEGVFIEVLWDIEKVNVDSRREGDKVMESVWWRGEVKEVKTDGGLTTAKIHYDPMGDFEAQDGEVRLFPFHMLVCDESDVTQLRWRYYESSGDVSYSHIPTDTDADSGIFGAPSQETGRDCQNCVILGRRVDELSHHTNEIDRFIHAQGAITSRLSATYNADETCQELFGLLRHKVAAVMQKPLLSYRPRSDNEEVTTVFDWSCAGNTRTEVDGSVTQFEMVCCYVKRICNSSYFTVDGHQFSPHSGCFPASTGVAEILFSSLQELCQALGIIHESDVMEIARKERLSGRTKRVEDAAVRVAGTYLVDRDDEGTPAAILICRSLHEGISKDEEIPVLSREDRKLNPRTVWYQHPLKPGKRDTKYLLTYIYPKVDIPGTGYTDVLKSIRTFTSAFALRWRPFPNPSPKKWTRTMLTRPDFVGFMEIDIPYVLFRGESGIDEVNKLVSCEYVKSHWDTDTPVQFPSDMGLLPVSTPALSPCFGLFYLQQRRGCRCLLSW